MATKRRKSRRRSCKHGKLKRPVKTKKGGKRRCKKSKRKSRKKRTYKMKSRMSDYKNYRNTPKYLSEKRREDRTKHRNKKMENQIKILRQLDSDNTNEIEVEDIVYKAGDKVLYKDKDGSLIPTIITKVVRQKDENGYDEEWFFIKIGDTERQTIRSKLLK